MAYGVGEDRYRQLLAITIGPSESQDSWADLLRQFLDRGLAGVQLVIADGHAGLGKQVPEAMECLTERRDLHPPGRAHAGRTNTRPPSKLDGLAKRGAGVGQRARARAEFSWAVVARHLAFFEELAAAGR